MLNIEKLEENARKEFFNRLNKELCKLFKGTFNKHYIISYGRFLLGLASKPYDNPRTRRFREIREQIYELAKECGITLKNYPDLT